MPNFFKFHQIKEINFVLTYLTISDVIVTTGLGLFGPIFAVYIHERIGTEHSLEVIGVATAIYLFTRSIGQIPLAALIDKIPGEKDDYTFLVLGTFLFALVPIMYLFISEAWHLYLIQFFYGIASAMVNPAWFAIFTRHIDKGKEGTQWGVYQTLVDMSGAISAPIGGFFAATLGFAPVMIVASVMSFTSIILLSLLKPYLRAGNQ